MGLIIDGHNISDIYIGTVHIDKIFVGETLVYEQNKVLPLYFEAVDPSVESTISISQVTNGAYDPEQGTVVGYQEPSFEYSYNGTTWNAYTNGDTISIGDENPARVYFRGDNNAHSWYDTSGSNKYIRPQFAITGGNVNSGGNIMSLLWTDITTPRLTLPFDHTFMDLFSGCDKLVTPPELPATTLQSYCYSRTFANCTALKTAPELPAETLENYCYYYMFNGCSALESGPNKLPALTVGNYCYRNMFNGCSSMTEAPEISATSVGSYGCYSMFQGCTALTEAPDLKATTLGTYCYQNMFSGCTSLTKPTKLPATTLAGTCYKSMFTDCPLDYVPELPAITVSGSAYRSMFSGSSSGIRAGASQTANLPYAYRIPTTGTGTAGNNAMTAMFRNEDNSGTFVPTINTTFYVSKPILT